nr:hypothetical protein [uncultured Caproiciproducens sp.]
MKKIKKKTVIGAVCLLAPLAAGIYLVIILRKKSLFSFSTKYVCPDKQMVGEIFKVGIPAMVFQLLTSVRMGVANIMVPRMTLSDRKHRILRKMRKVIEN